MENSKREKVLESVIPPSPEPGTMEHVMHRFIESDSMKEYRKTLFHIQQTLIYQLINEPSYLPS